MCSARAGTADRTGPRGDRGRDRAAAVRPGLDRDTGCAATAAAAVASQIALNSQRLRAMNE